MDDRRKPQRAPTFGDRNEDRRWATPRSIDVDLEDLTDRFEGVELQEMRAQRPIPERVAILEGKADESAKEHKATDARVRAIETSHAGLKSSLDTIERLAVASDAERAARHKREADEAERKRKNAPLVIAAWGTAIAGVIAAIAAAIHGAS